MTSIFKDTTKKDRKRQLFQIGVETLEKDGWGVSRERGLGKSSVRRITKGSESLLVSIRTSQDQWIAFPPKQNGEGFVTLDDVDVVLAVSVDENEPPRHARVHWLQGNEMRKRFAQAYKARREVGHVVRAGRGIWIPLYLREDDNRDNVGYVGGGAGLDHPPIAEVPLSEVVASAKPHPLSHRASPGGTQGNELTIPEAKSRLAATFGVPESAITITIEA